jgi:hypothetical protein
MEYLGLQILAELNSSNDFTLAGFPAAAGLGGSGKIVAVVVVVAVIDCRRH